MPPDRERVSAALAGWGIVEVLGDYRGAVVEQETRIDQRLTVIKRSPSFTSECLDCGQAPHVSPDDASIAVCLRCGRDKWL